MSSDTSFFKSLISHRLQNQQLLQTTFQTPAEMVQWMGAMQAQDFAMAKWAIGVRLPGNTDDLIEKAFSRGEIIRTHLLRPTWHFVSPEDIGWMLKLTAPQVKRIMATYSRQLGITDPILRKCYKAIEKILPGNQLTRGEIMQTLMKKGVSTDSFRPALIMMYAEMEGLVCSGARRGKDHTYAWMDDRVPRQKEFSRTESLRLLAERYFASHGPATVRDFVWWSGLSATDARSGLEEAKSNLMSETFESQTYWFKPHKTKIKEIPSLLLLPSYDEFLVGYSDRSASLDPTRFKSVITANGIFNPVIVLNGKVIGTWKRAIRKETVEFEPRYFLKKDKLNVGAIREAVQSFSSFLNLRQRVLPATFTRKSR